MKLLSKLRKEQKLTRLERRLLYNFVAQENNHIVHESTRLVKMRDTYNNISAEIRLGLNQTNLNNFIVLGKGEKEYKRVLERLMKKLD